MDLDLSVRVEAFNWLAKRTLERVEQDIAGGDYGKARDRLHGLIVTYPNSLALRQKLGDIYWQLQYPAMAGRYWYLEEDKSPNMMAARKIFEDSCGHNPLQIVHALKFKGNLESLDSELAQNKLLTLQAQVKNKYGYHVDFQQQSAESNRRSPRSRLSGKMLAIGCGVVMVLGLALMIIGLITVINWAL
jgi:hypothetical protein